MIRSAPSRLDANTADRPTAPSPTTATVSPRFTPALTAAWCPVDITSERVSSDRSTSSEWPVPGTGTRAAGERYADRFALAAVNGAVAERSARAAGGPMTSHPPLLALASLLAQAQAVAMRRL